MKNFNSTKLLVATIGLIFGAFITLSMDLPDENEVNGSHYIQPRTACGHDAHYGQTTIGITNSAGGSVYASTTNVNISNISDWTTTDIVKTYKCADNQDNDSMIYYCCAKADVGKQFMGWTNSKSGTTIYSKDNPLRSAVKITSKDQNSPTAKAWYAVFKAGDLFYATQTVRAKEKDNGFNSNGSGKVFVNNIYSSVGTWGSESTIDNKNAATAASVSVPFYAYAQADEGVFYGWYDATGKFKSASNPYTVSVTSTSKDSSNPTQGGALCAYFRTTTDTKYGRAIVNVQTSSLGNGLVFASTTNLNWKDINNEIRAQFAAPCTSMVKSAQEQTYGVSMPFYVYAVAKRGFKLQSWSTSAGGSAGTSAGWKADGVANPLTYSFTATSTNQAIPTDGKSCFAMFVANSSTCNINYKKPSNGNFTVQCLDVVDNALTRVDMLNTDTTTADKSISHYTSDVAVLTAQPANGYKVYRWVSYDGSGNVASTLAYGQNEYVFTTTSAQTIGVEFIQGDANFKIKESNEFCTTLQDAIEKATAYVASNSAATIVPLMDYTVPAGDYTIPAKVTLLIPFDDANTCYGDEPFFQHGWHQPDGTSLRTQQSEVTDYTADNSKVYRMLTLASGAHLHIHGTLNISAKRWVVIDTGSQGASQPNISGSGRIKDNYGCITMNEGSTIQVGDGTQAGKLYCWGRIRGEGTISVESGSEAHETFVYTDWRDNDKLTAYATGTQCFPLNQFYIQDIQVPITFNSGAKEILRAGFFKDKSSQTLSTDIPFIGPEGEEYLMTINSNGSITKKYDIPTDRLVYDFEGGISFYRSKLTLKGQSVSTKGHVFPITNNWTININSGTTNIKGHYSLSAGAIININKNAKLNINAGASLYVYDADDWVWEGTPTYGVGYCSGRRIIPLRLPSYEYIAGTYKDANNQLRYINSVFKYNSSTSYDAIRSEGDVKDAEIKVDGCIIVEGGNNSNIWTDKKSGLYTTNGSKYGNNIQLSSGRDYDGAKIYTNGSGRIVYTQVPGTLSEINNLNKGTANSDKATVTIRPAMLANSLNSSGTVSSYYSTADAAARTTFIYNQTKCEWEKLTLTVVPKFTNSKTADSSTKDAIMEGDKISENAPSIMGYTIQGVYSDPECQTAIPDAMTATHLTAYVLYAPNTNTAYTVKHYTQNLDNEQEYTLDSTEIKSGTTDTKVTPEYISIPGFTGSTSQEITITANGSAVAEVKYTRNSYTISFDPNGGTEVASITQKYESQVTTAPTPPTRTGYTFANWDPAIPETMPLDGYTCVAQWTVNQEIESEIEVTEDVETTSMVITPTGVVDVTEGSSLTITNLYIQADAEQSGELYREDMDDDVTVTNAYFDYNFNGAAYNRAKQNWYAFAVPFEVDPYSLQYKNGESFEPCSLGVHIDIIYYDGETRANNGPNVNAWKYVEDLGDKTLKPGVFYLAAFSKDQYADTVRFPKKSGAALISSNEVSTSAHPSSVTTDANWNGIANPNLYYSTLESDTVTVGQIYEWTDDDESNYKVVPLADALSVGKPIFIQTVVNKATAVQADRSSAAPKRLLATTASTKSALVDVRITADGSKKYSDRIFIAMDENAIGRYTIGADLVKAGVATKRAQMWVNNYGQKLCLNTIAPIDDIAEYELGIYVPTDGDYTIQQASNNGGTLYLTEDGEAMWNLSDTPCKLPLKAGTTKTYGLRWIKAIPGVVTDLNEAAARASQGETEKVIMNDHLLIINNGRIYNAQGTKLK